jgi:hypothetical protein
MVTYVLWLLAVAVVFGGLVVVGKRGQRVVRESEDAASEALPEIGRVAEKKYAKHHGPNLSIVPAGGWYPVAKNKV